MMLKLWVLKPITIIKIYKKLKKESKYVFNKFSNIGNHKLSKLNFLERIKNPTPK